MSNNFALYIRHGCHLCDAFLAELQQFDKNLLNEIRLIDVDESAEDQQRFGDKVPILLAADVEVCHYYFDADKLKSCLKLGVDSLE